MDRTELKDTLREERSSTLKSLKPDFYTSVDAYIHELEDEIKKINNPRSPESKMLEDELQSALTDVENIFIRRIRKITTRATSNAFSKKSSKQEFDKLLPAEQKVYEAVLSAIHVSRDELLEPILNPSPFRDKTDMAANEAVSEKIANIEGQNVSEITGDEGKIDIGKSNINEEYDVVRILKELPTFKGVDNRNYTLSAEDIVVLPRPNAKGLVKRNVAHLIQ